MNSCARNSWIAFAISLLFSATCSTAGAAQDEFDKAKRDIDAFFKAHGVSVPNPSSGVPYTPPSTMASHSRPTPPNTVNRNYTPQQQNHAPSTNYTPHSLSGGAAANVTPNTNYTPRSTGNAAATSYMPHSTTTVTSYSPHGAGITGTTAYTPNASSSASGSTTYTPHATASIGSTVPSTAANTNGVTSYVPHATPATTSAPTSYTPRAASVAPATTYAPKASAATTYAPRNVLNVGVAPAAAYNPSASMNPGGPSAVANLGASDSGTTCGGYPLQSIGSGPAGTVCRCVYGGPANTVGWWAVTPGSGSGDAVSCGPPDGGASMRMATANPVAATSYVPQTNAAQQKSSQTATASTTTRPTQQQTQQPALQPSFTYADAIVADSSVGAANQYGQVPNIYAVNVTNTGQVRLYCTADAKAQTYNPNAMCTGAGDSGCASLQSWSTNHGSTYVSPGNTARVVGIRYYAGSGSYTVDCKADQ